MNGKLIDIDATNQYCVLVTQKIKGNMATVRAIEIGSPVMLE
jgi:hypothetical protein